MDLSFFVSISDSFNFGREEIFSIRVAATANNHKHLTLFIYIIYKITYENQSKLNVFGKIDCSSSEHDQK